IADVRQSQGDSPRRRTKVIPHAFDERPFLSLVYAALIRATERWSAIRIADFEQRQLKAIREEIGRDFTKRCHPAAGTAITQPQPNLSNNDRTWRRALSGVAPACPAPEQEKTESPAQQCKTRGFGRCCDLRDGGARRGRNIY